MDALTIDLHRSSRWAVANVSSKGIFGLSGTIFDLVNVHSGRAHRMRVSAGGFGKGILIFSFSPSSSMSNYGYFTTPRPVNFEDFDGIGARMTGGSLGLWSFCYLTLFDGPAYVSPRLAYTRMSGWGLSTPNGSVDHGFTEIVYGDGNPLGFPETYPEINLPPTPEEVGTRFSITSKDDSFVVILPGDLLFDFDKFNIKPAAEIQLKQAAAVISTWRRPGSTVLIDGYTDNIGTDAYNFELSRQRANAAAQWFVSRGYLPRPVIKTQGRGKSTPLKPNADAAGRAQNRRVEIYVLNP